MRRKTLLRIGIICILLAILFVAIFPYLSLNQDNNASNIQIEQVLKNTWNELEPTEKIEVTTNWNEGVVEKINTSTLTSERYYLKKGYNFNQVYLITFLSKNNKITGNIEKLVDINTGEIVGYNFRD